MEDEKTLFRRIYCTSDTWLLKRQKHIQGTDAAKIMGVSPWGSKVDVYDEKVGIKAAKDLSDKPYIIYGKAMEPIIREQVMLDLPYFELFYDEFGILESKERPWQGCTLDGELTIKTKENPWILKEGERGVLEIKTGSFRNEADLEKWEEGRIPSYYYCQVLHQLAVTGYSFAIVAARLKRDGYRDDDYGFPEIRNYYRIIDSRSPGVISDIDMLNNAEASLWRCIEKKKRPSLTLSI